MVPLLDLTDEELAAVDGLPAGLVVSPWLEELDEAARDVAVLTAFRSLVARGVLAAPTAAQAAEAAGGGGTELEMLAELSQLLTLRRAAPTVLCAQRTTAGATGWRYVHLLAGERIALDEVVEPTGLHRFSLLDPTDVAGLLLDWLLPADAAQGTTDGQVVEVDPQRAADGATDAALLDELGRASAVSDVVLRRRTDDAPPLVLGVFAGPGLLVLSTTAPGEPVRLRPASRGTLDASLRELLEERP